MKLTDYQERAAEFLGRPEREIELPDLEGRNILVTGCGGFLGELVSARLREIGARAWGVDLNDIDISRPDWDVRQYSGWWGSPAVPPFNGCIHLAAIKDAPKGQGKPDWVVKTNALGTAHVLGSEYIDGPIVLASTCKAADPCTVYGASKLIAEQMTLNAGHVVMRLVNVFGSTKGIIEYWLEAIEKGEPLAVTDCERMFISPREAVDAMIAGLEMESGRYALDPGPPIDMAEMAERVFPLRRTRKVGLRDGDRPVERLVAEYERAEDQEPFMRIESIWQRTECYAHSY